MAQNLVLHGERFWISPYVYSCFVALREKELPFEIAIVSLDRQEQRKPEYRDRTVTGKVPALEHDGFCLAESSAIIEYLEETFAPPQSRRMLPAEPRQRARARQIMSWLRSDILALREERPTTSMFYERAERPLSDAAQAAADKLVHVAELVVPDGQTTLFGEFTVADADLAFALHRLLLNDHDVPAKVRKFAEAVWARPSVQGYVAHERPPYVSY